MFIRLILFVENVTNIQRYNFFLIFGSVGLLLFGSIGYGIHMTVEPSSYELRDTRKRHSRMNEFRIAHVNNGHNHNEAEHIH